ncbi:Extracellular esterase EstB [Vanrija pseudolonga]|uniref:Extracellular esterase EstB n=1 Tax=Vanrija pseudolonga TaxID=143232 RepID=A0AAF0Y589_9TREE|nr:Extracellular esterase EstB [Vanrija pseudolonga]
MKPWPLLAASWAVLAPPSPTSVGVAQVTATGNASWPAPTGFADLLGPQVVVDAAQPAPAPADSAVTPPLPPLIIEVAPDDPNAPPDADPATTPPGTSPASPLDIAMDPLVTVTSGLNDWTCKATPGRDPVILLHGLGVPGAISFITKGPLIASQGYCVFTPTYGWHVFPCWGSMRKSSKEIDGIVDRVRASTGASKVHLIGHSSGTTVGAYYLKFDGGAAKVNAFVAFGSKFRGTTLLGLSRVVRALPGVGGLLFKVCPSCEEILPGSPFLSDLAAGGLTVPGPAYTSIVSRLDTVVLPYTSGVIAEPGATDVVIQDHCPNDRVRHILQAVDPNVTNLILWALAGRVGPMPACLPFRIPGRSIVNTTTGNDPLRRIVIIVAGDRASETLD